MYLFLLRFISRNAVRCRDRRVGETLLYYNNYRNHREEEGDERHDARANDVPAAESRAAPGGHFSVSRPRGTR